jgi:hypothetical protein
MDVNQRLADGKLLAWAARNLGLIEARLAFTSGPDLDTLTVRQLCDTARSMLAETGPEELLCPSIWVTSASTSMMPPSMTC